MVFFGWVFLGGFFNANPGWKRELKVVVSNLTVGLLARASQMITDLTPGADHTWDKYIN